MNKDLIDNPALWRLGLVIGPDAIDVLAHRVVGEAPAVQGRLRYDAAATSAASAVEETIYANPMLLLPFRTTDIAMRAPKSLVVPAGTDAEAVASLLGCDDSPAMMADSLDSRHDIIYAVDRGVQNFLGRTFDVQPRHVLGILSRYYSRPARRSNTARMYIEIADGLTEILVLDNVSPKAAATFACATADEQTYYAMSVFTSAGLDAQNDQITVAGPSEARRELCRRLSAFVACVMPAILPSGLYRGDSTALSAPLPLLLMPLCE